MFCDKLIQLRREKGYSQEQLANFLNVSRQAVSKWEAGGTMPEIEKLIAISDIFGVSVDYLVRNNTVDREQVKTVVTTSDNTAVMEELGVIKQYIKKQNSYEYKSKTLVFGIPLVHIKFSHNGQKPAVAKGIIAIGNIAIGIISLGAISVGLLSFGAVSLGLLLAFGAFTVGFTSFGAISMGVFAMGGIAIGIYSIGGVAIASQIAAGGVATGKIAIGEVPKGDYTFLLDSTTTSEQIKQFILQHNPKLWDILVNLFSFCSHI